MTPMLMRSLEPRTRLLDFAPRPARADRATPSEMPAALAVFKKSLRSTMDHLPVGICTGFSISQGMSGWSTGGIRRCAKISGGGG